MNSISKYIIALGLLGFWGCAGVTPKAPTAPEKAAPPSAQTPATPVVSGPPREVIIFIPQTDQSAGSWFKLFDKYPNLRMVIAISPRFKRFANEPLLKEKALALQKAGRLELAMQLPNAPFLPLLINTDSARAALPTGTPLPTPAFAYPDDVTQIVAKAKTDLARIWTTAPKGMVLPQGAVNADLLKTLSPLGVSWVVGAVGLPPVEGTYHSGSLQVWDATALQDNPHFLIRVWDERMTGDVALSAQTLSTWAQALSKSLVATLPSDPDVPVQEIPSTYTWGNRTWTTKDWSGWIGSPHKNAAWSWLRTTRAALDGYKNSGSASVHRLDMAFEEIYNSENANYFSGITEGETTFTIAEDREKEFKATLSSVYRLIGQPPPDTLFNSETTSLALGTRLSSTTLSWETFPDGRGHLLIRDATNDDHGDGHLIDPAGPKTVPGTYDLQQLEVVVSSETLDWTVTLATLNGSNLGDFQTAGPLIDLYIDLNCQPNVGTVSLFSGRGAAASASGAWEYAMCLWGTQVQFFQTRGAEDYQMTETVPLKVVGHQVKFQIPRAWLRGNPQRWGYQALVMSYDPKSLERDSLPLVTPEMLVAHRLPIFDLIDPLDTPQDQLFTAIEEGKRNDIPLVRLGATR